MSRRRTLGFDRRMELAWLDAAAAAAARGESAAEARPQLFAMLEGVVAGDTAQSGRGKTVTVLNRIWFNSQAALGLRSRALAAFGAAIGPGERLAIHWAMCAGTHPFFVDVATATGRLLRMQGEVAQSQVLRRVTESWGERSTLHRAVQRMSRNWVEWGVLSEADVRGVYRGGKVGRVSGNAAHLLLESLLLGGERHAAPISDLRQHPALFPFDIGVTGAELRGLEQFRVDRQGLDVEMVGLDPSSHDRSGRKQ